MSGVTPDTFVGSCPSFARHVCHAMCTRCFKQIKASEHEYLFVPYVVFWSGDRVHAQCTSTRNQLLCY